MRNGHGSVPFPKIVLPLSEKTRNKSGFVPVFKREAHSIYRESKDIHRLRQKNVADGT
jgi:hypothetical protein